MKKFLSTTIILMMICVVGYSVVATRTKPTSPKSEKREQREQRRAARQAAYEKEIDSLVISRNFQFLPNTMQQESFGSTIGLSNPNFEVGIWNGPVDIFLPYIAGYVPPYRHTILNYTLPSVSDYLSVQTEDGWRVSFNTSMFSADTYTFVFDISSRYGTTTLTVKNPGYNDVQYVGSITQY